MTPTAAIDRQSLTGEQALAQVGLNVVIVTYRRLEPLGRCLYSVLGAALPADAVVLIVVNGSDAATDRLLREVARRDHRVVLLPIAPTSPAGARNAAMRHANGEIVYFLDDDVTIAPDLFERTLRLFAEHPEIGVVGGPNLTPPESSLLQSCIGRVLESPFGSASVRRRYRRSGRLGPVDDRALILCNLAIRRAALGLVSGPFPEDVVCNEENILLAELAARGVGMLHDPDSVVYHDRRGSVAGFCQQVFKYGRGRAQNTIAVPSSLSPVFLVPVAFLLYLACLPLLHRPIDLLPLAAYAILLCGFSLGEAMRARRARALALFVALFPACHLSYASGFVWELVRSLRAPIGRAARE